MELLTSEQAATYVGASYGTFLRWRKEGAVAPAKVVKGKGPPTYMWSKKELDRLMTSEFYSKRAEQFHRVVSKHVPKEKRAVTILGIDELREAFRELDRQEQALQEMRGSVSKAEALFEKTKKAVEGIFQKTNALS